MSATAFQFSSSKGVTSSSSVRKIFFNKIQSQNHKTTHKTSNKIRHGHHNNPSQSGYVAVTVVSRCHLDVSFQSNWKRVGLHSTKECSQFFLASSEEATPNLLIWAPSALVGNVTASVALA